MPKKMLARADLIMADDGDTHNLLNPPIRFGVPHLTFYSANLT
jgi:hypothetical protein